MIIQVLLSSFNGEKFIKDQIDSILLQTQSGVKILVRYDGSTDCPKKTLPGFKQKAYSTGTKERTSALAKAFGNFFAD